MVSAIKAPVVMQSMACRNPSKRFLESTPFQPLVNNLIKISYKITILPIQTKLTPINLKPKSAPTSPAARETSRLTVVMLLLQDTARRAQTLQRRGGQLHPKIKQASSGKPIKKMSARELSQSRSVLVFLLQR